MRPATYVSDQPILFECLSQFHKTVESKKEESLALSGVTPSTGGIVWLQYRSDQFAVKRVIEHRNARAV
jgi:hypothetical protein